MNLREYIILGLFGLGVVLVVTVFQSSPGYMDADYYMAGGVSLAQGSGFKEFFIWNYLNDPKGIPHPSHAYWMPLASIVSALGMMVTGLENFSSARIFFVIIAAAIAPLTACLSYSIYRVRDYALLAGIFAVIPGFYLAYLGTTDSFGINMVLGCIWLLIVGFRGSFNLLKFSILGIVSGLLHLGRADGIIWFILGIIFIFTTSLRESLKDKPQGRFTKLAIAICALVGGYLLIMGPWMLRNLSVFGTLLSPGGLRTLWLINYDDLFAYPGNQVTFARWLASGIPEIVGARWHALTVNLQTAIAVQGKIFLAPLMIAGLWKVRDHRSVKMGGIYWLVTLFIMTAIFPEVGWRGGFFHSGAAIQPLLWAAAPAGLAAFITLGVRIRRWDYRQAWRFFRIGSIVLVVLLTFVSVGRRVTGSIESSNVWDQSTQVYTQIEAEFAAMGISKDEIVMVNNPPGFYLATGRFAISIPNGDIDTTLAAAERYNAKYIILEPNHPKGMEIVFNDPEATEKLHYLKTIQGARIFQTPFNK